MAIGMTVPSLQFFEMAVSILAPLEAFLDFAYDEAILAGVHFLVKFLSVSLLIGNSATIMSPSQT
jgi:hypothetical protein